MTISVHKWLVFMSACVVMVVPMGFFYSLGALFVPLMSVFQASRTEASLVQSIAVAVSLSTGFIHGLLVHRFGMVKVGLAGSCLASIGLGLSYFATSIYFLIATIGIATSIGSICLYVISSAAVGIHFTGKQSLILLSVVNSCSGVGGMVFPFILAYLTRIYSLHGTLLICAGLVMNTLPCALLWTLPLAKNKTITVSGIKGKTSDSTSGHLTENTQHGSSKESARPNSMHQRNYPSIINYSYEEDAISLPSIAHSNDQNEHSHVKDHIDKDSITNQPNQIQRNNTSETTQEIRISDGGDQTDTKETTQEIRNSDGGDQTDTKATTQEIRNSDDGDQTDTKETTQEIRNSDDGDQTDTKATTQEIRNSDDGDQTDTKATTQESRISDGSDQTDTKETTQEIRNNDGNGKADTNFVSCNHQHCSPTSTGQSQQTADCTDTKPNHSKTDNSNKSQDITLCKSLKHLAKNKCFVFFIGGLAFSYPPIMVLITFIVDAFQDSGLSIDNANIGLLLLNAFGILGRLLPGIMMQSKLIKTMTVPITASLVTAACMTGFILTDLLHLKLVFLSLTGVAYGIFVSCFSVTALDIVGADHLGHAIGFAFTLNGLANIAAGPISGFIRDSTGSYLIVFLIASGVQLIAVVMFVISHRLQYFKMETPLS